MIERTSSFLGLVEVDSGTLVIGDPGHLLPHAASCSPGIDYREVVNAGGPWAAQQLAEKPVLLVRRFGGDGSYPVFGEFEGDCLKAVLIDLDPDDQDEGRSEGRGG